MCVSRCGTLLKFKKCVLVRVFIKSSKVKKEPSFVVSFKPFGYCLEYRYYLTYWGKVC